MKKIFLFLIFSLLLVISIFSVNTYNEKHSQSSSIKENSINKGSQIKLKDLNGKTVSLDDFKGKKVFLNFWATWCPPCKSEMPDIQKLYEENKNANFIIITVNTGDEKEKVIDFMKSNNYTFNVLLDINNELASKYNIFSIPTSFFIDKDGTIIHKINGPLTKDEMKKYLDLK